MTLNLKLITPPAVEPVTLALAKQQLVMDAGLTDDDALIQVYISAARQHAEDDTNRAFFNQTWQLSLDHFPWFDPENGTLPNSSRERYAMYSYFWDGITIRLPKPSCVSVTSITYVDLTGATQTLDRASYYVDTTSEPARIVPFPGTYWPYTQNYLPGSVRVTYVTGSYGDGTEVNTCPGNVVLAILQLVAHWYQNREAGAQGTLPPGWTSMLDTVRFDSFTYGN